MTEENRISLRNMTPAEKAARKALKKIEAEKAMMDYNRQQKAFYENRERLKAERLAREEAEGK
jgi:hypothetical protein